MKWLLGGFSQAWNRRYKRLGQKTAVSNVVATTDYTYTAATLALDTETITYDIDTNGTPELVRTLLWGQSSHGNILY
jgi:hypothetical protein